MAKTPHPEPAESDWNDLKVLLALARGGSVAGAARAMGVDQSTVSRRLAALETALGCPLLLRGGREFQWTAEGRTMIAAAEAAETAIDGGIRCLRNARLATTGKVRVSTTPSMAALLVQYLDDLRARRPGIEFDISGSMAHVDLAKGEADIVLRGGAPSDPDLVARTTLRSGWYIYASEAYLREAGRPQAHDDLRRHRLVLFAPALHGYAPGMRWLEDHRDDATPIVRVDNMQAAAQLASLGRGLVVLPHILAQMESALVRAMPEPVAFSDGYLAYHVSQRGVPRIHAAMEALGDVIEAHGEAWTGMPLRR